MNVGWPGTSRRTPIGIDASGRFINAVQLGGSSRKWRVEAAASIPRADSTVPLDVDETTRMVEVLERQGFRGHEVILAMPNDLLLTKVLELPPATPPGPIPQIARVQLAAAHKCDAQTLEVACWNVPKPTRVKAATCVLAVAAKHDEANSLIDIFEAAGMVVRALDVHSWAVARACQPLLTGTSPSAAVLRLGWTTADLVVLCGGVVVYERALAEYGLNRLHMLLTGKFDLDREVTDYIVGEMGLRSDLPGNETRTGLLKAVRSFTIRYFNRMLSELRLSLAYAVQEFAEGSVDRLLIHGEGASIPGLAAHLSSELDMEVRTFAPTDVAECGPSVRDVCALPALSTAVGLAQHPRE